jgi:hypothetical protein
MVSALVLLTACNECDFLEKRCSGNAVEQCGAVDQQVGRTVARTPCVAPNPSCVQEGKDAFCAVSATGSCTPGQRRCDGNTRLECRAPGVEVALDCSKVEELIPGRGWVATGYVCQGPAPNAECQKP